MNKQLPFTRNMFGLPAIEEGDRYPHNSEFPLTFADLAETCKQIDAMPPFAVAVWFIDMPDAYAQFMLTGFQVSLTRPFRNLDVYEWTLGNMKAYIEKRKSDEHDGALFSEMLERGELFPFRYPGVWVEMNKGNHYRLIGSEPVELTTDYANVEIGGKIEVSLRALIDETIKMKYRPPTAKELARYQYFERITQYVHVESGVVFEGEAYWVRVE